MNFSCPFREIVVLFFTLFFFLLFWEPKKFIALGNSRLSINCKILLLLLLLPLKHLNARIKFSFPLFPFFLVNSLYHQYFIGVLTLYCFLNFFSINFWVLLINLISNIFWFSIVVLVVLWPINVINPTLKVFAFPYLCLWLKKSHEFSAELN